VLNTTQHNTLHVDFNALFGFPSYLTISSWEQGIDWSLHVEQEPPEPREYLKEAAISLEYVAAKLEYQQWYQSIPANIRKKLKKYPEMGFTLLYHISRYIEAEELFNSHPNLLWFLLCYARTEKWTEDKVINLIKGKRTHILNACKSPHTPAAVKLLSHLNFDTFCIKKFWKIQETLKLTDYAKFNYHKNLDYKTFLLLIRFPVLLGSRLMLNSEEREWNFSTQSTMTDILNMGVNLRAESETHQRIKRCKNKYDLETLHDRLIQTLNHQSIKDLPSHNFPAPPFLETEHIKPICGSYDLAFEGQKLRHCIRSYEPQIMKGKYYAYQIHYPERATIGIHLHNQDAPVIDQIKLICNRSVSQETQKTIEEWLASAHLDKMRKIK